MLLLYAPVEFNLENARKKPEKTHNRHVIPGRTNTIPNFLKVIK